MVNSTAVLDDVFVVKFSELISIPVSDKKMKKFPSSGAACKQVASVQACLSTVKEVEGEEEEKVQPNQFQSMPFSSDSTPIDTMQAYSPQTIQLSSEQTKSVPQSLVVVSAISFMKN